MAGLVVIGHATQATPRGAFENSLCPRDLILLPDARIAPAALARRARSG
jgi:hypothetical protein